jgi:hypothetical protein
MPFHTHRMQHVPIDMIDKVPPIVIDTDHVLCCGGDDTLLGHPIEYIKVCAPAIVPGLRLVDG